MKISAKDQAVKFLSAYDRSEKELADKLLKKGYSEEEVSDAIAFCIEYGYLNDERFAERFYHDAVELKKLGSARIKAELRRKGINEETIDALDFDEDNEREILKNEIARRFKDADFTDKKVKNRVFGYFLRRGFKAGAIIRAMGDEDYDIFE